MGGGGLRGGCRLTRSLFARRLVGERQVKRERAALAGGAADPDFTAEQASQLAADGKPQARASILAAGGAIGLLERLKNAVLLVRRNPDAGVDHGERHHRVRRIELRMSRGPARFRDRKSTRLNSSHLVISYAVFCLKKKKNDNP